MSVTRVSPARRRKPVGRFQAIALNLAAAMGLLYAVTFLPPDNSLAEMVESGVLRVCVPDSAPPLVTAEAGRPGYDIELLGLVAQELGVRLAINRNSAIGADFNPRNWRLTRAQCQIIAGGIVSNDTTRSFLQLLPNGLANGWAQLALSDSAALQPGDTAAIFPGPTALDRLALSRYLRARQLQILSVNSAEELSMALRTQRAQVAISDQLTLSNLQPENARIFRPQEPVFAQYPLAFGLWKGDATLLRALQEAMRKLEDTRALAALASRYGLAGATVDPSREKDE